MNVISLRAKEIKDSRGKPAIEVEVCSARPFLGKESNGSSSSLEIGREDVCVVASVPSGASTGSREAKNVSVEQAIKNVNEIIAPEVLDLKLDTGCPTKVDKILLELDGMEDKSNLGANAMLGVSNHLTITPKQLSMNHII